MRRFFFFAFVWMFILASSSNAQIVPPYTQDFDSASASGWSHYAISGTDDWQRGVPSGSSVNTPNSSPNAFVTNLSGNYSNNSVMALETPAFDFSDTTKHFYLSFYSVRHFFAAYGTIEYSTDTGNTWTNLNGGDNITYWYNNGTRFAWSQNSFRESKHGLEQFRGLPHVLFRFKFETNSTNGEGWLIDDFGIQEETINFAANHGVDRYDNLNISTVNIASSVGVNSPYDDYDLPLVTNYYWSTDDVFDAGDSLIATKSGTVSNSNFFNWNQTISIPPNTYTGNYFVFYKHDPLDARVELDEGDNMNYVLIRMDTTMLPPYSDDFEGRGDIWKSYHAYTHYLRSRDTGRWVLGPNRVFQISGEHSPKNAWYISDTVDINYRWQSLESPAFDFTTDTNNVFCYFFRMGSEDVSPGGISVDLGKNEVWGWRLDPVNYLRFSNVWDGWDCRCHDLAVLNGEARARIRFKLYFQSMALQDPRFMAVDNVYIGPKKPELSMGSIDNRTFLKSTTSDTLRYSLINGGMDTVQASVTEFYWSTDTIIDAGDSLIATVQEAAIPDTGYVQRAIVFQRPQVNTGKYYIISKVDVLDDVTEIWENNNILFKQVILDSVHAVPYINDFETEIIGWSHYAQYGADEWEWGAPSGTKLNRTFSGTKAFYTKNTGPTIEPSSRMDLVTPVFDLTTLENPVLEFNLLMDNDSVINTLSDRHEMNVSYSTDGGDNWLLLDTTSQSFKGWYYHMEYADYGGLDRIYIVPFYTNIISNYSENVLFGNHYQSRDNLDNFRNVLDITFLKDEPNVRFRFNMASPSVPVGEGAVIDNFSIREATTDLFVRRNKDLYLNHDAKTLKFTTTIENDGNYITNPDTVNFYLSADNTLDGNDYYLGNAAIKAIRPKLGQYLNLIYDLPDSLSAYQYLIHEIGVDTFNIDDVDTTNNIHAWPLKVGGVSTFPYLETFNDTTLHGWSEIMYDQHGVHLPFQWRFRHMVAPAEPLYQSIVRSGELFLDRVNCTRPLIWTPYAYLETPGFDFSCLDSIHMSFELMCDGGNFHFSTDGGETWQVMDASYGSNTGWFNKTGALTFLNGEPGWSDRFGMGSSWDAHDLESVTYDLSFLADEPNVKFRFKHHYNHCSYGHGNGDKRGLRLDDFRIDAVLNDTIDFVAIQDTSTIQVDVAQNAINFDYKIWNQEVDSSGNSATDFYWSTDSLLDEGDSLIGSVLENSIHSGDTLFGTTSLTYPVPVTGKTYYIITVADGQDSLVECNTDNNITYQKVVFLDYANYHTPDTVHTINVVTTDTIMTLEYRIANDGDLDGKPSVTSYYWSTDSIYDAGDLLVGTDSIGLIQALDTITIKDTLTVPEPLAQNKYFLFYIVDAHDSIPEGNEEDNTNLFRVLIDYPNYNIDNTVIDINQEVTNLNFTIALDITNNSAFDGIASNTYVYWSLDNVLDASDSVMHRLAQAPIDAGVMFSSNVSLKAPQPITQNTYYIFYEADVKDTLLEENENDNIGTYRVNFLFPDYASIDDSIAPPVTIPDFSVDYSIINTSNYDGLDTRTRFYWSEDNVLDKPGDSLLLILTSDTVAANDTAVEQVLITYPQPIVQNEYHLFYEIDALDTLPELDESNNVGSIKVAFRFPNYRMDSSISEVAALNIDTAVNVSYEIFNPSDVDGLPTKTEFFWSSDSLLDGSDTDFLQLTEAVVPANDTLSKQQTVKLPPFTSGSLLYYLILNTDHTDTLQESRETDNIRVYRIRLTDITGIRDLNASDVFVYLEPGYLNIRLNGVVWEQPADISLYTTTGQRVFEVREKLQDGINKISIPAHISSGHYIIGISSNGERFTKKATIMNH